MIRAAVIGGGAAGLAAALSAARGGAETVLLEAGPKCGRKLVLTGNGRCNLAPAECSRDAYQGGGGSSAEELLRTRKNGLMAFLASAGIEARLIREGYYPRSEEAPDVLRLFLAACIREGVKVHPNTPVFSVRKENGIFRICTRAYEYEADRVILCCGSPAGFPEGSACTGYDLAVKLGHTLVPVRPALVPLKCSGLPFPALSGCRIRADISLLNDGKCIGTSSGQIQFTAYGLSGIAILDLSGHAGEVLAAGRRPVLRLDLFPEYTKTELASVLTERAENASGGGILAGLLPRKAADCFVSLYAQDMLPSVLKGLEIRVDALRPMENAQAAAGGISCEEIDRRTFESLLCPGLFLCGEMLDTVGICGGYNLSYAFLGGMAAGEEASHA